MRRIYIILAFIIGTARVGAAQTTTPNLSLTLPIYAQQNWGPLINGDLSQIDTAIGFLQNPYQGAWSSSTVYVRGAMVQYEGLLYTSLINSNYNNLPTSTSAWQAIPGSGTSIPAAANFVYAGISINDDDSHSLSSAITITGWTTTGGVTAVTNSGTSHFSAGQWISMRAANGWPSCPSGESLGTGCTLFQVLASPAPTATSFSISTASISAGSCSSSCGSAYSAMSYLPFATSGAASFPSGALGNTYVYIPSPVTISGLAAGYSTFLHPLSPAVTGRPAYLIINSNNNDAGTCTSAATTESAYQTLFQDAHADGYVVVVGTPNGTYWSQEGLGCSTAYNLQKQVDEWLRAQGKASILAATPTSTQYWDIISDIGDVLWDGSDTNFIVSSNSGFAPAGADLASRTLAHDIYVATGSALPRNQVTYGYGQGSGFQNVDGYLYAPVSDETYAFQWWNAARTSMIAYLDTSSNGFVLPQSSSYFHIDGSGLCFGGRPFCVGTMNLDGSGDFYGVGGLTAASGASNANCWNTNGGYTACAGSGMTWPTFTGLAKYGGSNNWVTPTYADVVSLFGSGSCSGYLYSNGTCSTPSGSMSGMTAGQVPIAASPTTVTTSMPLAGSGGAITTGPSSSTNGDCPEFTGTQGQIADSGSPCGAGSGAPAPQFGTGSPLGISPPSLAQFPATGSAGGTGTVTATFGSSVSSGHVVYVLYSAGSSTAPTMSDSLSTSFTSILGPQTFTNFSLWCGTLSSSGSDTITASGPNYGQIVAYEVANGTCTTDAVGSEQSGTSATATNTTTTANDFLITNFSDTNGSGGSISASSGWTASSTLHNGFNDLVGAYQVATTATSYSVTWTSYTSGYLQIVSFLATASPVSGTQGQVYYETNTTPYTSWVYNSGTWHQVQ